MSTFWARQRRQWSLYAGKPDVKMADTGFDIAQNILQHITLQDRR